MAAQAPVIHLASRSPRREELLRQIRIPFATVPVEVDERRGPEESPEMLVLRLALEKARSGWLQVREQRVLPVLAADTVVVVDDAVLGKPTDRNQAAEFLGLLSGRTHRVLTGVALVDDREATRLSVSTVTFRGLTDRDIRHYCYSGEPDDKAGAYGIQGIGGAFVERLEGSYSGVMGLPLCEVSALLDEFAIPFRHGWSGLEHGADV